ncbi:MAG: GNAT family protein [Cyanobacteria bacterium J06621_15]
MKTTWILFYKQKIIKTIALLLVSGQKHIESLSNNDIAHFIIEKIPDNYPVGYTILKGLTDFNQTIELKRIVITEKGKGYGRETLQLIKKLSFEDFSAHRLQLDVKGKNLRAKKLYESEGFIVEGCLRECLKTADKWESLILMSMLKQEYFNI